MPHIIARNMTVEFPVYNSSHRSIKSNLLRATTGGRMGRDSGNRVAIKAVDDMSFEIKEGDRVGLTGHNGAGKSTLLRVLSGVYKPVSGSLDVKGRIASLLDISLGMDGESTGYENIMLRGTLMGLSVAEIKAKTEEIADFSELGEFMDMPIRTYSSGMAMRLAFAISTTIEADILLMDEWLSVGDAAFSLKAAARLNEMVAKTPILVIATHSQALIDTVCNRQIQIERGKVSVDSAVAIEQGSPLH